MTEPVKAVQEDVTLPRTMVVLRVIMSSRVSRSKVAHCSGMRHEATTIANMRQRFTLPVRAGKTPLNPIDTKEVKLSLEFGLFPCDTGFVTACPRWRNAARPHSRPALSALAGAHDQDGDVQMMPHGTDGGAEDQVLEPAVPVGAHDDQVGVDLFGVVQDCLGRRGRMGDRG